MSTDEPQAVLPRAKRARPAPHFPDTDLIAKLHSRARRNEVTGCLVWRTNVDGKRMHKQDGRAQLYHRDKKYLVHRLAWMAQFGPIPAGLCVCHKCDNPLCIATEHLFLGTHQQNLDDAVRKGRMAKTGAVLTFEQVRQIKRRLKNGETSSEVARAFNVRYTTIRAIKIGRCWGDVDPAPLDEVFDTEPRPSPDNQPPRRAIERRRRVVEDA